jgi:hypothetical protein
MTLDTKIKLDKMINEKTILTQQRINVLVLNTVKKSR